MPPPQFPSDSERAKPRPRDSPVPPAAGKRPPSLSAIALAPTKKIARPTSAPNVMALSAARARPPCSSKVDTAPSTPAAASRAEKSIARPTAPQQHGQMTAPPAARPHPPWTPAVAPAKNAAPQPPQPRAQLTAPSAAVPRRPAASSTAQAGACRKPASSSALMAPRAAESVPPARRLSPGTAVYVRTRFMKLTRKCWLVIWLAARVVSASDAYHCTVKYAADLNEMFAGKIVSKPIEHVRVAPQRAAKAEPRKMAQVTAL